MTIGQHILDTIIAGNLVFAREDHAVVFIWAENAAEQLTALVHGEPDYRCKCGQWLQKCLCDDCVESGYAAMEKSRKEHGW